MSGDALVPDRVTPPTRLPAVLIRPMSLLYRVGINHRNRRFDLGKGVTKLDRPVISIGNLSTGGTGKTPVVHRVVRLLLQLGHRPAIAMRGYGAKPGEKGDEQLEHEMELPGVAIVAQPDRVKGLRALFASATGSPIDCVVLDDGFQHRRLARDLDIVLIDASRPPDRDALLPCGHLREPIGSLARAGLVLLTHAERVDERELDRLRALVERYAPGVPVCAARHAWDGFRTYIRSDHGWSEQHEDLSCMRGKPVRVVCGIGNSDAFLQMIRAHGMNPEQIITLADHAPVSAAHIGSMTSSTDPAKFISVVMTRKDWVKARTASAWPMPTRVCVPHLSVRIDDERLIEQTIQSFCFQNQN